MPDSIPAKNNLHARSSVGARRKIVVLFGTRPEVIKLAPVINELRQNPAEFEVVVVSSGQHVDLIAPFVKLFGLEVKHDLRVMRVRQTPNDVCARVLKEFDRVLHSEKPDLVLVQGDTATALAGALAAFNRQIAVGHVEAGLRSGDALAPFPEEMYRRQISGLTTFHFAATNFNRDNLLEEMVPPRQIFVTGNPVIDALEFVRNNAAVTKKTITLLAQTKKFKRLLLTTHRRESHGAKMRENLAELRAFIDSKPDTVLLFPVHPNPEVRRAVTSALPAHERIFLLEPLEYADFVALMANSWLVISDSGGVQEETPSLGKPLLVLRENTERPEAVAAGVARVVGSKAGSLTALLMENYADETWINSIKEMSNPFGDGSAARKIADVLRSVTLAR